jgi:hypothetical protein
MLPRLLREQLRRVEHGLDPINIMRDPSTNKRIPSGAWNTILSPTEAAALPYSEDLCCKAHRIAMGLSLPHAFSYAVRGRQQRHIPDLPNSPGTDWT